MTESQVSSQFSNLQIEDGSSSDYSDGEGEEFGDMHRLILQGIFYAGWMNAKGVKNLFLESCKYLKCKYKQLFYTGFNFKLKLFWFMGIFLHR